jgi:hypothetical protein
MLEGFEEDLELELLKELREDNEDKELLLDIDDLEDSLLIEELKLEFLELKLDDLLNLEIEEGELRLLKEDKEFLIELKEDLEEVERLEDLNKEVLAISFIGEYLGLLLEITSNSPILDVSNFKGFPPSILIPSGSVF